MIVTETMILCGWNCLLFCEAFSYDNCSLWLSGNTMQHRSCLLWRT